MQIENTERERKHFLFPAGQYHCCYAGNFKTNIIAENRFYPVGWIIKLINEESYSRMIFSQNFCFSFLSNKR
jgi:hypothetical protein